MVNNSDAVKEMLNQKMKELEEMQEEKTNPIPQVNAEKIETQEEVKIVQDDSTNEKSVKNNISLVTNKTNMISDIQKQTIELIEELIEEENSIIYGKSEKRGFGDKYKAKMISIRPEILKFVTDLSKNTTYTMTEILDKLLINGLKNTKF